MKIIIFGDSQVATLKSSIKYIQDSPNGLNPLMEKWKKEIEKFEIDYQWVPGYNFEKVEISNQGKIILPRYIYKGGTTSKLSEEILWENKKREIDPSKYQALIWAQGPNPLNIYWEFMNKKNDSPSLLTSNLIEHMIKDREYQKINSSTTHIFYIGSPNVIENIGLNKKEFLKNIQLLKKRIIGRFFLDINTKNMKIHKRNILYLKSFLDNDNENISYIFPPTECIDSNWEFTLKQFAHNPGFDSIHVNEKYGSKIMIEIIKKIINLRNKNIIL